MNVNDRLIVEITFTVVILGWLVFAVAFLARRREPQAQERKRNRQGSIGMAIQALGYLIAWTIRRPYFTPLLDLSLPFQILLMLVAIALVVGSLWMMGSAFRTLGKQWSVRARLVEGHELVTSGPYRLVRHPIYSGMLGMLVATTIAVSHWVGLIGAIVVFLMGTTVRLRAEEKLLMGAFGATYEAYMRRVPALIPWGRPSRGPAP